MTPRSITEILRFKEHYAERIWGGTQLRDTYGKAVPGERRVGEAWMISDHPRHESIVAEGPRAGQSLRSLLTENAAAILGSRARLTVHGRFPLLLKLLDTAEVLSIQVHPDDAAAQRLGEQDGGKTEMWHVLAARPGSEILCGLPPALDAAGFESAIADGTAADRIMRLPAARGLSVFVPAGTVHAIGGGILLAEIQQNSDLTYRIHDWGRMDGGKPRELHLEKALAVTHFGAAEACAARGLGYGQEDAEITVLAACRHFAAECVTVLGTCRRALRGESFHLLLAKSGDVRIADALGEAISLAPGEAVMVPGCAREFSIFGSGEVLVYYVPDLRQDIAQPLTAAGHDASDIRRLGGTPETNDLSAVL